ncbi:MAG: glycosyltransferase [Microthrixaceae bacterium]
MTVAVPVPGRIRAVVAMDDPASQERALGLLRAARLPDARVDIVARPVRWTTSDVERLTSGRVDYLLLLSGSGELLREGVLADALRVLRSDLTTAAVGPSVTGADDEALELAVSGHLLLARADAVRDVGGFTPALDGVLDDLELCWRFWAAGHRVRSIAAGAWRLRGEDADEPARRRSLLRALATVLEPGDLADAAWSSGDAGTAKAAASAARRQLEGLRRREGGELVPFAHRWVDTWAARSSSGSDAAGVVAALAAPSRAGVRRRILVVTTDVLAPSMAGPAIRAVAIARQLATEHDVLLVSTQSCDLQLEDLQVAFASEQALERHVEWCDVVVFQGWVMAGRPWIRDSSKVVVADLYDPMQLEQLEHGREAEGERGRFEAVRGASATLNEQVVRADFMLCASRKQRDLWTGVMAAMGRINPVTYDADPSLDDLISIAPFGVPEVPFPALEAGEGAIRGKVDGIGAHDHVVLWGGGVYNWFDPLTLVRAIDSLRHRLPTVRLVFLGLTHPNPTVPTMRMAHDLRVLATELDLVGTHVFFNDGWVPYDERWRYLGDADVGVSTHLQHIETEFSFRTRILDYLWASLPIVATGGDAFATLIEDYGAGRTVAPGDLEGLSSALEELLTDPAAASAARRGSAALAQELTWSVNLAPLVEFCRSPRRAPDVACPTLVVSPDGAELERGLRRDLRVALAHLRAGGVRALAGRVGGRLRRRLGRA